MNLDTRDDNLMGEKIVEILSGQCGVIVLKNVKMNDIGDQQVGLEADAQHWKLLCHHSLYDTPGLRFLICKMYEQ